MKITDILKEMDKYFGRNDYLTAEKIMLSYLDRAEKENNIPVLVVLYNECIGFYRKQGQKSRAYGYCDKILALLREYKLEDTLDGATSFINCGTAKKAFGEAEKGIPYFLKAEQIYKSKLSENDKRMGGFYNNFGLALMDVGNFEKSEECFENALSVMAANTDGKPDMAITHLNIADLIAKKYGLFDGCEAINGHLDIAQGLLNECEDNSGYYAFVCEKCAPTFGYYGHFLYEQILKERARKIYEGA